MKTFEFLKVLIILISFSNMCISIILASQPYNRIDKCNPEFIDSGGYTCQDYADYKYCTSSGGYGPSWDSEFYGDFEKWANDGYETARVCPQCGCGGNRFTGFK